MNKIRQIKSSSAVSIFYMIILCGSLIIVPSVFAGPSMNAYCYDNGRVEVFRQGSATGYVQAKQPDGEWFDVSGTWTQVGTRMKFTSVDKSLLDRVQYEINVESSSGSGLGWTKVICPGYKFSCMSMVLDIQECKYYDGEYAVKFTADNIVSADDLSYFVETVEGNTFERTPVSRSKDLMDFFISEVQPKEFIAGFKSSKEIKSFSISHSYCDKKSEMYYTMETELCNINRCTSDVDCKDSEFCDSETKICARLHCDDCYYNHKCISQGEVVPIAEISYFCNDNGLLLSQKKDGEYCTKQFECEGICKDNTCTKELVQIDNEQTDGPVVIFSPSTENPGSADKAFSILKLLIIFLIISGVIIYAFIQPLPALGRYALRKEQEGTVSMFEKLNSSIEKRVFEIKLKLKS